LQQISAMVPIQNLRPFFETLQEKSSKAWIKEEFRGRKTLNMKSLSDSNLDLLAKAFQTKK